MFRISKIAGPLLEGCFQGQLLSVHAAVSNFVSSDQRVLALQGPALPMGPFSVQLLDWPAGTAYRTIQLASGQVLLDDEPVDCSGAARWEADVVWPTPAEAPPLARKLLLPFVESWPGDSSAERLARILRERTVSLQAALAHREELSSRINALVGLGNGLTPAGDDYLIGFFAATFASHSHLTNKIKTIILNKQTTSLSRAFLLAAQAGAFSEPWHHLAAAMKKSDPALVQIALTQLTQFGASSGRDAVAGFAQTYLTLNQGI